MKQPRQPKCSKCGKEGADQFYVIQSRPSGFDPYCKDCRKLAQAECYANRPKYWVWHDNQWKGWEGQPEEAARFGFKLHFSRKSDLPSRPVPLPPRTK